MRVAALFYYKLQSLGCKMGYFCTYFCQKVIFLQFFLVH